MLLGLSDLLCESRMLVLHSLPILKLILFGKLHIFGAVCVVSNGCMQYDYRS
jgi:hypothetical protein